MQCIVKVRQTSDNQDIKVHTLTLLCTILCPHWNFGVPLLGLTPSTYSSPLIGNLVKVTAPTPSFVHRGGSPPPQTRHALVPWILLRFVSTSGTGAVSLSRICHPLYSMECVRSLSLLSVLCGVPRTAGSLCIASLRTRPWRKNVVFGLYKRKDYYIRLIWK